MTTVYKIGIGILLGVWIGAWLTWLTHPYERCIRAGHTTPENIMACVDILEH